MEYLGKFWGPEEIIEVRETDMSTHRGVPLVEVVTKRQQEEDKTRTRTTTRQCLELVATEEAKDWNHVQETKISQIVRDVMAVITDAGLEGMEMQPFVNQLSNALGNRLDHAAHIKFEGNDDEYVPGGNVYSDWSLAKAEYIIEHKDGSDSK